MPASNRIKVDDNGNITLQDSYGSTVVIDVNETETLLATLNGLNPAQLAVLRYIADAEGDTISPRFKTLLNGLAAQKNIVGGSISNVQQVRIGDERPNLLVIDNAGAGLSGLYDTLPHQPNWHILVTSRERIYRFDLNKPFDRKNIVGGSVEDADEFTLGDEYSG